MEKYRVVLENSKVKDYYELERVLKRSGVDVSIQNPDSDGTEMGSVFDSLIILLPLVTPTVIQLLKALSTYFEYKKTQAKKVSIVIEKNGKTMRIETENIDILSAEEFISFFSDENDVDSITNE